jgi:hypothetical protein
MWPKLSICVVSRNSERIADFLSTQRVALLNPGVELLVFCSDAMAGDVHALVSGLPKGKVISDGVKSGPNRKRNLLLRLARGEFVAFLDDDSLFVQPKRAIETLLSRMKPSAHWLLWTARYRQADGKTTEVLPSVFSRAGAGSGIEWNQAFRRTTLIKAGGWHPDFCTGERWRSGGALKLMIKLRAMGCSQFAEPRVVIEHPAQLDNSDPSSCRKIRSYRYAIGAVIASEAKNLGAAGVLSWIARLGFSAPLRGLWDLVHARWISSAVRLSSPYDALRGAIDWTVASQALAGKSGAHQ